MFVSKGDLEKKYKKRPHLQFNTISMTLEIRRQKDKYGVQPEKLTINPTLPPKNASRCKNSGCISACYRIALCCEITGNVSGVTRTQFAHVTGEANTIGP
jgi:hypothetical protein